MIQADWSLIGFPHRAVGIVKVINDRSGVVTGYRNSRFKGPLLIVHRDLWLGGKPSEVFNLQYVGIRRSYFIGMVFGQSHYCISGTSLPGYGLSRCKKTYPDAGRKRHVLQFQFSIVRKFREEDVKGVRLAIVGVEQLFHCIARIGGYSEFQHHVPTPGLVVPATFAPLPRRLPSGRSVDGFAVHVHPLADLKQPLLHDGRNFPMFIRPDIQKKIASAAHLVHEMDDERLSRVVIPGIFSAIITIGIAHPAAFLPIVIFKLNIGLVFRGENHTMIEPHSGATPVDGHHPVFYRTFIVYPRQKFFRLPHIFVGVPITIGPEYIGLITGDEFLHLGPGML